MVGAMIEGGQTVSERNSMDSAGFGPAEVYLCPGCPESFTSRDVLTTHILVKHEGFDKDITYEALLASLKNTANRVEYLLRRSQDCRDSDVQLIIAYMKKFAIKQNGEPLFKAADGNIEASASKEEWEALFSCFETIRRMRERIQNAEIDKKWAGERFDQGLMPSEEIERRRYKRSVHMRKAMVQTRFDTNPRLINAGLVVSPISPDAQKGANL